MNIYRIFLLLFLFAILPGHSQDVESGPVIPGFGPFWEVPEATFPTDTTTTFRVVFDVMNSPEDHSRVNPWMETAARFLNMHANAGVPPRNMHVALVVHNKASKDLLDDANYQERFGVTNPNSALLQSLLQAGARVIFCGQSSHARNVPIGQTVEGVQLSLSAMTALIQLQDSGYRLIKF